MDQPHLVGVAAGRGRGVHRRGIGNDGLRRVEREVPAQRARWGHPQLVGRLDHQQRRLVVGYLAESARLRDVHPVALAVAQRAELRLQQAGALVHERQQIPVDVADEERHRLGAPRQQHLAVGVGEQQHRPASRIGGVAGLELARQHVDRSQRARAAIGGGVVAAVHVRGAAGESAAAEFVVLQAVQVGVQPPRGGAFSQVNEGFHGLLHYASSSGAAGKVNLTLLLLPRWRQRLVGQVDPAAAERGNPFLTPLRFAGGPSPVSARPPVRGWCRSRTRRDRPTRRRHA